MAFELEFKLSCSTPKDGSKWRWFTYVLTLLTAACVITFGGLGSMQNTLAGTDKQAVAQATLGINWFHGEKADSTDLFRYFWFIVCFQIALAVIAWYAVVRERCQEMRLSLTGLFVIATLLTIQAADAWLSASETELLGTGLFRDRARTTVAGFIMCATLNAATVLGLGWKCPACGGC